MWKSHMHDDKFGPKAAAYRSTKGEEASIDMATTTEPEQNGNTTAPAAHYVRSTPSEAYPGT